MAPMASRTEPQAYPITFGRVIDLVSPPVRRAEAEAARHHGGLSKLNRAIVRGFLEPSRLPARSMTLRRLGR
jgi:hypothetical protein